MLRVLFLILFCFTFLFSNNLNLTQEEKEWLKQNPVIKIGIDPNFAPVEYVDEKGNFRGVTADYLKYMQKALDVNFVIVKDRSWNEIVSMIKSQSIDALSCIVKTPKRSKYLHYTSTYLSVPMVIVTNKETGYINSIEELNKKAVAVIDGYTPQELLQKNHKDIYLVKTKDLNQALQLVSSGKTFAHVGNLSRVTYLLKEKGFQNLSISGITHYTYKFSMGVEKSKPILRSILQKAFNSIPKQVKDEIYDKWFPINFKDEKDKRVIWSMFIIILIIILIFSFWIIRLNNNIRKRKIAKDQLLRDKEWLNKSLITQDLSALRWDLQTNEIKGNPNFAKLLELGKDEIIISFKTFKQMIDKDDFSNFMTKVDKHFSKEVEKINITLKIKTKNSYKKVILCAKISKYDIFNHPKSIVGTIKELKN